MVIRAHQLWPVSTGFNVLLLFFFVFFGSWKARGMHFLQSCSSSALIPKMPSLSSGASLVLSALVSAYTKVEYRIYST